VEGDACRIRDLGSRNGVHAHGSAVTVARLRDGDTVTFGLHAVRLTWR
jgi:pSer/pThr/pTyr-binding forkhead associated (FHA) protein